MKMQEYFYPTINFQPQGEYKYLPKTNYAEIELIPNEDKPEEIDLKLLQNLERYASRAMFTEDELKEIDNPNSDSYEHIIAYVHFNSKTGSLNRICFCVITANSCDEIKVNLGVIQKMELITKARQSLENARKNNNAIDFEN